MVLIIPACVTTDGVNLYSITIGGPSSYENYYILLKSNPNPSPTLSDLSWTTVSVVKITDPLNSLQTPSSSADFTCHIDETTKAFTTISRKSSGSSVRGVQYQPDSGSWKNINTSSGYDWGSFGKSTQLFNFKDATASGGILMQAHIDSGSTKIFVAAMDSATSTMNQNPASWSFEKAKYGDLKGATFAGNSLYTIGSTGTSTVLNAIPISGASTNAPLPSTITTFDAKVVGDACGTYLSEVSLKTLGTSVVIQCEPSSGPTTRVFIFDGKSFSDVPPTSGTVKDPLAVVPMPGTVPFIFMTDKKGMYSIPLSGSSAGSLLGANLINVTDSIFENLTNGGTSKSSTSVLSGVITGISILIVLCCLGCCFKRKRKITYIQEPAVVCNVAVTQQAQVQAQAPAPAPAPAPAQPEIRMEDLIAHLQRQAPVQPVQPVHQFYHSIPDNSPVQPVQHQFYHSIPDNPPAYQSPTIVRSPVPQPWQPPQEQAYSMDESQKAFQKFPQPPSKASPRGPALVMQPGAPQALPSTMVQMPGPQTGYYHDAGSAEQQPSSPASSSYVRPPPTGPGSPQYRG